MNKQKLNPLWALGKQITKIIFSVKTIDVETSKGMLPVLLADIIYIEAWGNFLNFISPITGRLRAMLI